MNTTDFDRCHWWTLASHIKLPVAALLSCLWIAAVTTSAVAQDANPAPAALDASQSRFAKVVDAADGKKISLELSSRSFAPSNGGQPIVRLVGVVHIGDESYYKLLQQILDTNDLVLFERVKPAAQRDLRSADDAAKAKATKSRQRMLAVMLVRYQKEHGSYPMTLAEMSASLSKESASLVTASSVDGWGNAQRYEIVEAPVPSFDIVSLGADGADEGTGASADLKFSAQKPLTSKEKSPSTDGIQAQLADALGLKFQLAMIDYTKGNWRNSDMSIDEVQERLAASGASSEALFSLLDGSSFTGKFVSLLLKFIKASPQMAMTVKIVLIEALANSDDLLAAQAGGGKDVDKMMKVIIEDRNEVVFKDLAKVIETEPKIKTIAVFYGAGHLEDMERRLTSEMGYTFQSAQWIPAITLDLSSQPEAAAQAKSMRTLIRKMAK